MNTAIILAFVVAASMGAPVDPDKDAVILKYENDNIGIDGYNFALNVQVVGEPNGDILDIVARWPGSAHYNRIFDNSCVKMKFERGDVRGLLFGDSGFETSNGLSRSETAEVKNIGTDAETLSVRGTLSYVGADGVTYTIDFVADENGFQPVGDHLPK